MIEVTVKMKGGKHELARIRITKVENRGDLADYSVQLAVDTGVGPAIYQRAVFNFPRKDLNILALIRLALETLEEKELKLDGDPDTSHPSDLARRLL